ncbi:MAG: hypothetical protein JWO48_1403 [Bryobacterales bacterium]|nr:hypothetical protein [Bryobacterales bacterium]
MQPHNATPTLNHLFFQHLDAFRRDRLLSWHSPSQTVVYSTERFAQAVFALRNFLSSCGLADGDRVAIFSENRPEWHIADFAILLACRIVVPIYATLAPGQIQFLLEHSGCRAVIVSGQGQWEMLASMLPKLPRINWVLSMDDCDASEREETVRLTCLTRILTQAPPLDEAAIAAIRAAALSADPNGVATIVYTSGTTARPKGVMLSHANIMFDLDRCVDRLSFRTAKQALSVLPLPHVFERLLCYGYFRMGVPIAYGDPHDLRGLLKLYRPQVMGCVPRILEKIREAVQAQIDRMPGWKQAAARRLFVSALRRESAVAEGRHDVSSFLLGSVSRALLALRIRQQLGGLKYFICGGAWLDPAVELFFRSVGFTVLQGYGMTETSPVITLTPLGREKLGSVGPALEGVELRIGDEGEVMTRGPHVMLGYYNESEPAAGVLRDGWLLTGDLGALDEHGYLRITGRRKEMLVLSNGKKIGCALVERALERSPVIQSAFIVGDGRKFASALIVPHVHNLARMARDFGIQFGNASELLHSGPVWSLIRREIETQQAEFSNFERVRRFCFLPEEALLDPELVTPTQKMRRTVLERQYRAWIEQMYVQENPLVIAQPRSAQETQSASV